MLSLQNQDRFNTVICLLGQAHQADKNFKELTSDLDDQVYNNNDYKEP